jgi:hypothetical protein
MAETNGIPGLYVYDEFITEGKIIILIKYRGVESFIEGI